MNPQFEQLEHDAKILEETRQQELEIVGKELNLAQDKLKPQARWKSTNTYYA